MPTLHTHLRQPIAALWYSALGAIVVALVLFFLGLFLSTASVIVASAGLTALSLLTLSVVVILVVAYPILHYFLFSYELTEHSITIHSGIIFRQYETINFNRIQVVDNERGPLLMLFGLTIVEIWTASPDQVEVSGSGARSPHPDARLVLARADAENLKQYITQVPSSSGSL